MSRYDTIQRVLNKKISRIGTSDLPEFIEKNSDVLLIATDGDRCDLISQEYYGRPDLWWFIASINNLKSNNIKAGTQLRVPISVEQAKMK